MIVNKTLISIDSMGIDSMVVLDIDINTSQYCRIHTGYYNAWSVIDSYVGNLIEYDILNILIETVDNMTYRGYVDL